MQLVRISSARSEGTGVVRMQRSPVRANAPAGAVHRITCETYQRTRTRHDMAWPPRAATTIQPRAATVGLHIMIFCGIHLSCEPDKQGTHPGYAARRTAQRMLAQNKRPAPRGACQAREPASADWHARVIIYQPFLRCLDGRCDYSYFVVMIATGMRGLGSHCAVLFLVTACHK